MSTSQERLDINIMKRQMYYYVIIKNFKLSKIFTPTNHIRCVKTEKENIQVGVAGNDATST